VALSPSSARKKISDARAKLTTEQKWIAELASGKTCVEMLGLDVAIYKSPQSYVQLTLSFDFLCWSL